MEASLTPGGGARWAGKVVWGVGGTSLDENSRWPKIVKKKIEKVAQKAGRATELGVN